MANNRTMEELVQAPTEGYGEAIVIPKINADHFEIKTNLLQLVQENPYHGFERENPHIHINNFRRITSTLKFRDVPNDVIKIIMFPYSLERAARVWYDNYRFSGTEFPTKLRIEAFLSRSKVGEGGCVECNSRWICMRTRNSYFSNNSSVTISRCRNKRRTPDIVELEFHTIVKVAPMADNRTMEELLQAPTEGYGEAIVIPEINANHFEIKKNFYNWDVPNDVIKLLMFLYSLEGSARVWYDKEPPNSILTWEDLVNKFVNQFFPPSKTTNLKNEISRFTQIFAETFGEAWERFKEMLRACPHHGFTELAYIDTFYNGLNDNDQDSLNATAGGNLLSKTTREAL
nr:reverse transcriptase domain-containing protein [Tanacetum cinerariifolium]